MRIRQLLATTAFAATMGIATLASGATPADALLPPPPSEARIYRAECRSLYASIKATEQAIADMYATGNTQYVGLFQAGLQGKRFDYVRRGCTSVIPL